MPLFASTEQICRVGALKVRKYQLPVVIFDVRYFNILVA